MNYERLRENIEDSLHSISTEGGRHLLGERLCTDTADEIIKLVKAEIASSDMPEKKSLAEVNGLILQVNRVLHKWMDDSRPCCTNYEDRKNFYNAYWQEIVDIVKQSLRS